VTAMICTHSHGQSLIPVHKNYFKYKYQVPRSKNYFNFDQNVLDKIRPPPPSSQPPRLDYDLLDIRPKVVAPPRLKSPSRQRAKSKSSLPVSTRNSPPKDNVQYSSVDESPRGRTSRPSQILRRAKSTIPQRGAEVRDSMCSVDEKDNIRPSEPVSKIPKHSSRSSESPVKTVFNSSKTLTTRQPTQPASKTEENVLSTVNLRRNANEYLKVNQVISKSSKVSEKFQPPSDEISPKDKYCTIDYSLAGAIEAKSTDSLDSQPKTFIVSRSSDLTQTTEISDYGATVNVPSLTPELENAQHLLTEVSTLHTQSKPKDDPKLCSPAENNNNTHPTSSQANQHTSTDINDYRRPEPPFITNDNVIQIPPIVNEELVQPVSPNYENVFHPLNITESSTEKVLDSAYSDDAENIPKTDNLSDKELIREVDTAINLIGNSNENIVKGNGTIASIHSGANDLNTTEKIQINKCEEKAALNCKLEPIYESLGKTAFNLKTPSSRSPNILGSVPRSAQPVIQTPHGKYGGSSSASGRDSRPVRKYWDEDSLCSPLTRQQRAAANPGLSLPASSQLASTQGVASTHLRADKSFSLGDYYKSQPVTPKFQFNLKTSGQRFLHRLQSLRQTFKSKQEIKVFPVPDSADGDRVFFRGFSGINKADYEAPRKSVGSDYRGKYQLHSPTAPPRQKRGRSKPARSLSLTDADIITEAVSRGRSARIEDIYPDFPRSTPIYAVIDKSKKRGANRCTRTEENDTALIDIKTADQEGQLESQSNKCELFRTKEEVTKVSQSNENISSSEETEYHSQSDKTVTGSSSTLSTKDESETMVKSHSASNSPITNSQFDANNPKLKLKKKKHKKKKETDNDNIEHDKISNKNVPVFSQIDDTHHLRGPYVTPPFHVTTSDTSHVITPATLTELGSASDTLYIQKFDTLKQREACKEVKLENDSRTQHNLNDNLALITNGSESRRARQAGAKVTAHESVGVIGASYRSNVVDNSQFHGIRACERSGEVGECNDNEVSDILSVAEDSIRQAESILSSLLGERRENFGQVDGDWSLAPDIEKNIRQLEETQQTIGNVIDIFRTLLRRQKSKLDLDTKRKASKTPSTQSVKKCEEVADVQHKVSFNSDIDSIGDVPEVIKNKPEVVNYSTNQRPKRQKDRSTDKQVHRPAPRLSKTADTHPRTTETDHLDNRNSRERKSREHRDRNWQAAASKSGDEASKNNSGPSKYQRKNSGTRLLQTCQKYLSRQSSESSVSPQRGAPKKTTWYDGDAETSDNSGHNKRSTDGDSPPSSAREKFHDITRSFGKGKKKHRKLQPKKTTDIFDVVSDIQAKQETKRNALVNMGSNVSSAEEAHDADEVADEQFFITATPDDGAQATNSSPTNYQTAESSSNSGTSPKKRIHLLIESFEQKMDVADGESVAQSSNHLSPSASDKSSRTSIISSQSGSSESFDDDQQESKSSASTSAGDDLTPQQRQEKKVYYVAREIMSSEKVFVDVLRLLNTEFREYVERKMQESRAEILPDEDFARMFSNLPELLIFNEDMLKDFEDRVENWDTLKKIADVIVRKGPFLKLYTIYIRDFSFMCSHFDECTAKYQNFKKVVEDFESLPRCQNLKLKHFMLKPVQRLPQYRLLLEDYLKHLEPESVDFDDTTKALRIVSEVAEHANNTVKKGDSFQRLLHLQSRLGDFELIKPGRELIKEGELQKISRKELVPRYFILLSDCLLYTTYHGTWVDDSTSLRVSYVIMLNQLRITVPQSEAFQTEFSITSNVRSVTVRASNVNERNDWVEAINSAIEENQNKKASFLTVDQLNPLSRMEGELGDTAPVWIPDQRVTMCQLCSNEFTLVNRRHHCRACGKVVCSSCSAYKAPIKYRQFESVKVCSSCFDALKLRYRQDPSLLPRFKKKDTSRTVGKYIPQRLKLSANAEESQMSGYLKLKKGSRWKTSWFVLKDRVLYTYKASEDAVAVETVPVLGWQLETLSDKNFELYEGMSAGLCFQLSHPGQGAMVFCAENDNFAEKWMTALREATTLDESAA